MVNFLLPEAKPARWVFFDLYRIILDKCCRNIARNDALCELNYSFGSMQRPLTAWWVKISSKFSSRQPHTRLDAAVQISIKPKDCVKYKPGIPSYFPNRKHNMILFFSCFKTFQLFPYLNKWHNASNRKVMKRHFWWNYIIFEWELDTDALDTSVYLVRINELEDSYLWTRLFKWK